MIKELVCVNCPKGCKIKINLENNCIQEITGYGCLNGKKYAVEELTCPMRVLTTTIRIKNAPYRVLPVMSDAAIPLNRIKDAMDEIKNIEVNAPVQMDQVIVSDFLGLHVNLIASRSMEEK